MISIECMEYRSLFDGFLTLLCTSHVLNRNKKKPCGIYKNYRWIKFTSGNAAIKMYGKKKCKDFLYYYFSVNINIFI